MWTKIVLPILPELIVILVLLMFLMALSTMFASVGGLGAVDENGVINPELNANYINLKQKIDKNNQSNFPIQWIFGKDVVVRENNFNDTPTIYVNENDFSCFYDENNIVYADNEENMELIYQCEQWNEQQIDLFKSSQLLYESYNQTDPSSLGLIYPITEPYLITAGFNSNDEVHKGVHRGVDFVALSDSDEAWQIHSAQVGTVIATNSSFPVDGGLGSTCGTNEYGMTGGGNYVIVEHKDQNGSLYYTLYCHLIAVNVDVGQEVKQGDVLGIGGNSGNSTGRHLHFELRLGSPEHGNSVDPMPYFNANISQDKVEQMTLAGISVEDQEYADYIIEHESSWNYQANNPTSGAYGLCQALPPSKMESAGSDWKINPITQLKWCNSYAIERYGSWESAYNFWSANSWW